MSPFRPIAVLLSVAALAGCQSVGQQLHVQNETSKATVSYAATHYSAEDLARMFVGRTVLTYDVEGGNQVAYFDPGGSNLLWHSASRKVVPGDWKLEGGRDLCIRNGAGTYTSITPKTASLYACEPLTQWRKGIVASAPGNIFSLRAGETRAGLRRRPAYDSLEAVLQTPARR